MPAASKRSGLRTAGLVYRNRHRNLGDAFQTLAAERLLGPPDAWVFRERVEEFAAPEPHALILNGNFHQPSRRFPPSEAIVPVFFGFRPGGMLRRRIERRGEHVAYLCRHAPIGCRDRASLALLRERGVDAFLSGCLTTTWPRRTRDPEDGETLLVDLGEWTSRLPEPIRRRGVELSHACDPASLDRLARRLEAAGIGVVPEPPPKRASAALRAALWEIAVARALLVYYERRAARVVTTRLHAALPCLAMGIPVVFLEAPAHPADGERLAILDDLGVPRHAPGTPAGHIEWSPPRPDLSAVRRRVLGAASRKLAQYGITGIR